MKKFAMAFGLGLLTFSCTPKKEKIIAIDVLLTPSEEMHTQALDLNRFMKQNNPATITLDDNHIPHITLLQCFINKNDLPKVRRALHGLYEDFKNDTLIAESLFYYKEKEESFAMIAVEKNDRLVKLHEKIIALVKPFIVYNGNSESFVQNPDKSPIGESTLTYVPEFVEKHSYENFDPHITLGVAQRVLLDSLAENIFKPIPFKATSISIYHLGDHGTAQKLLWKSE